MSYPVTAGGDHGVVVAAHGGILGDLSVDNILFQESRRGCTFTDHFDRDERDGGCEGAANPRDDADYRRDQYPHGRPGRAACCGAARGSSSRGGTTGGGRATSAGVRAGGRSVWFYELAQCHEGELWPTGGRV